MMTTPVMLDAALQVITPDYQVVVLSWTPPESDWSRLRLVRSTNGMPSSITDGTVLLSREVTTGASVYNDLDVAAGRRYYYALFLFTPSTQAWVSAGTAEALVIGDRGYTDVLWGRLPELYRGDNLAQPGSGANDALQRFLSIFGFELDGLRTQIDSLADLQDVGAASSAVMPAILRQFLFDEEPEIGNRATRLLAANAPTLYNTKGTIGAAENLASILTGWDVRIGLSINRVLDSSDSLTTRSTGRWGTVLSNASLTARTSTTAAPAPYERSGYGVLTSYVSGPVHASTSRNGHEGRLHSIPVVPGRSYTASIHVRADVTARLLIDWYDKDGRYVSTVTGSSIVASSSGWSRPYTVGVAPYTAVYAAMRFTADTTVGQEVHISAAQFEDGVQLREWHRARAVAVVLNADLVNEILNPSGTSGTQGWNGESLSSDANGFVYTWS